MSDPAAKLQRLLGGAPLGPLRQRLRRHFERRDGDETRAYLRLGQLDDIEREALAQLTGRPPGFTRSLRIDIVRLDAELKAAGLADSLRDALEQLDGPIPNRVAARNAALRAWARILEHKGRDPRLRGWLQSPDAPGLLRRLARRDPDIAETLLAHADAVLQRLPAMGVPRAQLAAEVLGDAHALDKGRPVASLVLSTWRHKESPTAMPPLKESARETWARAGVLVNELARPALFLNLPMGDPAAAGWNPGEPSYLSLRRLLRNPPSWRVKNQRVFVCENPNMVAIAADRLGARCAPLVCTDGMPAAAQRALLSGLRQAGATLLYHGDFDWPGVHIANHVIRTWQALPWRMASSDYEAAAGMAPSPISMLPPGDTTAIWDPGLASAMRHHRVPIAEEAVAAHLLQDLKVSD